MSRSDELRLADMLDAATELAAVVQDGRDVFLGNHRSIKATWSVTGRADRQVRLDRRVIPAML